MAKVYRMVEAEEYDKLERELENTKLELMYLCGSVGIYGNIIKDKLEVFSEAPEEDINLGNSQVMLGKPSIMKVLNASLNAILEGKDRARKWIH